MSPLTNTNQSTVSLSRLPKRVDLIPRQYVIQGRVHSHSPNHTTATLSCKLSRVDQTARPICDPGAHVRPLHSTTICRQSSDTDLGPTFKIRRDSGTLPSSTHLCANYPKPLLELLPGYYLYWRISTRNQDPIAIPDL